ncbi:uncharacterized protein LOC103864794 isoform X1 [Brassica rapa]|uniref:uncharacterized protein LOC103864794 isoform X1 n=1 Tax=Brassica campestris TaxID=3711 RepID=UPI0004F162A1|nr:uncharacterized protein LOC103864794 isoform X1 [Brassica rapa]
MAIIEDIDAELAHGSSTLLLPGGQPPGEQPPVEVQEAPPLPHAQYGGRILFGCSLFGCNHVVEAKGQRYCSANHQNIAEILSSQDQAYVVVDGFFVKDSRERCFQIVLALLKRVEDNLGSGLPLIKDDTIFHSHPRDWSFISSAFLDGESDRSWLFFHSKSNPNFKTFYTEGQRVRWSRSRRFLHKYLAFEGIKSTVAYLRPDYEKKSDVRVGEGDPFGLKGWALIEYFYKAQSLFCLSFSSEKNNGIFSTVKESTQKRVRSDPGESSRTKTKKKKSSSSVQPSLVSEEDPVKVLILSKKRELEAIYTKAHIHVSDEVDPSGAGADVSDFDSTQLSDCISILEDRLESAKLEALVREPIIVAVGELMHAKREEEWFSEFNKRGNLFNLLTGDETTIERAAIARILVSKIPSMIVSLTGIVESWETERGTSFLYDKHLLLDLLNEEKQKL